MSTRKPRVLMAMAFERDPMGCAYQSMTQSLVNPNYEAVPASIPSTVIHLARNQMIEWVRNDPSIDYLLMSDSDQVWHPRMVERLLSWNVPAIAPVIVQRNGPALPVAYVHVGVDADQNHRYNPSPPMNAIGAYMSMFKDERFDGPSCILPLEPDHEPKMLGLPPAIREGLRSPLYEVDAIGTGQVLLSGEMIRALPVPPVSNPSNAGGWFSFAQGGEDFHFMRLIRAAGFPIYVDRGAFTGHATIYVRGPDDLWAELARQQQEAEAEEAKVAALPPATELAARLKAAGDVALRAHVWESVKLPGELAGAVV